MKITLMLLAFAASNVYSLFIPVFTSQTENDVVPKLGSGLIALEYYHWEYSVMVDGYNSFSSNLSNDVKSRAKKSVIISPSLSESYDEFYMAGEFGLSNSIGIQLGVPYLTSSGLGTTHSGIGDLIISGKWNFMDSKDDARAGIKVGCMITSEDPSFGSGVNSPWAKLVYGIPMGDHRLIGNVGYKYVPADKYGYDEADHIPFSLVMQLNGYDVLFVPIEFIGDYQLEVRRSNPTDHSYIVPGLFLFHLNFTMNGFIINDHLSIGGGLLVPIVGSGDVAIPHLNTCLYF
jgi:hypothetical protein